GREKRRRVAEALRVERTVIEKIRGDIENRVIARGIVEENEAAVARRGPDAAAFAAGVRRLGGIFVMQPRRAGYPHAERHLVDDFRRLLKRRVAGADDRYCRAVRQAVRFVRREGRRERLAL